MVSENTDNRFPDNPCFENSQEEASFWKKTAEEYFQKLQDVRDEFEEFQEGSRELEGELETQLEQYENRVSDLLATKCKLEEENDVIKEKLERLERSSYAQVTELQDENHKIKAVHEEMTKYIRELEQTNDDLERSKRATITSLESFDVRLNNAIERNAFLENELEEKEQLIITVQRLKDESRDLKSELAVTSTSSNTSLNESKLRLEESQTNNDLKQVESKTVGSPPKTVEVPVTENDATTNKPSIIGLNTSRTVPIKDSAMNASARISALNIVSDLLRKVGALESKLATCRNFVQEHPPGGKGMTLDNSIHSLDARNDSSAVFNGESTTSSNTGLVKVNV